MKCLKAALVAAVMVALTLTGGTGCAEEKKGCPENLLAPPGKVLYALLITSTIYQDAKTGKVLLADYKHRLVRVRPSRQVVETAPEGEAISLDLAAMARGQDVAWVVTEGATQIGATFDLARVPLTGVLTKADRTDELGAEPRSYEVPDGFELWQGAICATIPAPR